MAESTMYAQVDTEATAPPEENETPGNGDNEDDLETAQVASENSANEQREKLDFSDDDVPIPAPAIDDAEGVVPKAPPPVQRLPRKAPELPQIERRNYLLHQHFVQGDVDACKALIKEQLDETQDQCEYAYYVKGLLLRQEGKVQESLDTFQRCAMLNSSNQMYIKQIGRSLFLLGKHKQAIDVFDEALKLGETDWEIYHWKALCYFQTQSLTEAKECAVKAWNTRKHEASFRLLGKICSEEGDLMTAMEAYRKALEVAPDNTEILTTLGLLYLKTGSNQQAFEVLGKALSYDPSNVAGILAAGSMMQKHGDNDVALTKYRVAAQQTPDSAQLWNNIGMCFHGKKKYVAAISCLKRANYLAPFDWKILYNLGIVHFAMQQCASAFHFLSSAINLQPKVGTLYMAMAVVLTHLEDFVNARQAYNRAIALDAHDPGICVNFAVFELKHGNRAEAVRWLTEYERRAVNTPAMVEPDMREVSEKLHQAINAVPAGAPPLNDQQRLAGDPQETPIVAENDQEDANVPRVRPTTSASTTDSVGPPLPTADPSVEAENLKKEETASVMSVNSKYPSHEEEQSVV